eukprot:5111025-Karenia_brevis.AAC.1
MFAPTIGWKEGRRTFQLVERRGKRANGWQEGTSGLTGGGCTRVNGWKQGASAHTVGRGLFMCA